MICRGLLWRHSYTSKHAQQGKGARFYVHIWNTRTWCVRAVAWITQIRYLSRVHTWILQLKVHNHIFFFAETESLRACNTRFLKIILDSAKLFDLKTFPRMLSSSDEIRSAHAQPAMKFVQDDEIPEMKMRKQLFQLVKFLRGASRNLWSFLQGRDNRRDGQGEIRGVLPHTAESTDGAIGQGNNSSFSWAVSGLVRSPLCYCTMYIRAL